MYYMIHATDQPEAPKLTERAYNKAVQPKERLNETQLDLGLNRSDPGCLIFEIKGDGRQPALFSVRIERTVAAIPNPTRL